MVKKYALAFGVFCAMTLALNLVVRPAVQKFNVPLLKDAL